jgi:drug/metabolite transporter (DMT)-like permease
MPFYVFAWIANVSTAFGITIGKLSSKHQIANPWLYNFVWGLLITLFTLPFALSTHPAWPTHWGPLWLMGFFSMSAGLLFIFTLRAVDVSIIGPMYSLRTAVSVILGVLLFHERLQGFQAGLILLILFGGMVITVDERFSIKSFFRRSIALALVTITFSSIYGATVKNAMQFEGYWTVTIWGDILAQVLALPTIWFFRNDIKKIRWHQWSGVVTHSVFSTLGSTAQNAAYAVNIGISTAIMSAPLSMVLAILFSIFAPKLLEKHTMKVYAIRLSGAAIMILAAIRLSM